MLVLERGWGFKSPSAHKGKAPGIQGFQGFFSASTHANSDFAHAAEGSPYPSAHIRFSWSDLHGTDPRGDTMASSTEHADVTDKIPDERFQRRIFRSWAAAV